MAGKTLKLDIKIDGKLDPSVQAAFAKLGNLANKASLQQKQLQIGNAVNKMASVSQRIMGVVTKSAVVAGTALSFVGGRGVKLASDLQEVQNVVDVTFAKNAKQINDWSKTALESFGLSELSAKRYSSTLGAMMKSSGVADKELIKMSKDMTQLAGDFASFYNLDTDMAFDKIRAGISGETEPLKQIGINMSVANLEAYALSKGIKKAYKEMTQAEQVSLRYSYLMKVSADAQGDFTRTQSGFANQTRLAKEKIDQLLISIGEKLLPQLTPLIQKFNDFITTIKPETLEAIGKNIADIASGGLKAIQDILEVVSPIAMGLFKFLQKNGNGVKAVLIGMAIAMAGLTAAQWYFNIAAMANPMVWIVMGIIVAVAALTATIYYLANNWSTFVANMGQIWNDFVNGLVIVGQGIVGFFQKFGRDIFIGLTLPFTPFILAFNAMISGLNNIPGINIPLIPSIMEKLPKFADGGTLTRATALIAGEAGTETVVPHNNKPRSQMLALTAMQGAGLNVGGNTYVFSPVINGGSSDVKQTIRDSFEEFKTMIERYEQEKGRVTFA